MGLFSTIRNKVSSTISTAKEAVLSVVEKVGETSKKIRSSVSDTYKKVDTKVGGILPGGVSTTEAKTSKTIRKAEEIQNLNTATEQLNEQKERERELEFQEDLSQAEYKKLRDLTNENIFEKIGIGRSEEEKSYQDLLSKSVYYREYPVLVEQTIPDYNQFLRNKDAGQQIVNTPLPQDTTAEQGSVWNKLLVGGLIVAGILILPPLLKK